MNEKTISFKIKNEYMKIIKRYCIDYDKPIKELCRDIIIKWINNQKEIKELGDIYSDEPDDSMEDIIDGESDISGFISAYKREKKKNKEIQEINDEKDLPDMM